MQQRLRVGEGLHEQHVLYGHDLRGQLRGRVRYGVVQFVRRHLDLLLREWIDLRDDQPYDSSGRYDRYMLLEKDMRQRLRKRVRHRTR
jgi:hypothetical protein